MVANYLKNLRKEYIAEKKEIEGCLHDLEIELKENMELKKMLQSESDESFASFVPREVNPGNKKKQEELEAEQKNILAKIESKQKLLGKFCQKIDELESVIKLERDASVYQEKEASVADKNALDDKVYRIRLLETQEEERYRISRELHDDTVQNLTSLVHKAELCSKLIDMDPVRCRLELLSMTRFLREVISDTRKMIFDLRPMTFDDIGLDVTIERTLDKLETDIPKKISFHVEGESYPLKPVVGITILRIIQETCSNALCHAYASRIDVLLKYEEDQVKILVEDDGVGFRVEKINNDNKKNFSGFGIDTMKERVYLLSGEITIDSELGQGTRVTVCVPAGKEEDNGSQHHDNR